MLAINLYKRYYPRMKKLTQTQLAKDIGRSQSFLSEVLAGKCQPSPETAARLEAATGKHRLYWLYPGEYDEAGVLVDARTPEPRP